MEPDTTQHEVQAERFARELGQVLSEALTSKKYDVVGLVAPAHFLGLLRAELTPQVAAWTGTKIVLWGGEGDCAQLNDTWTLAAGSWTRRITASQGESCLRRGEQCTCLCQ